MLNDVIGPPQIAALLVLVQRGAEELYSARNTQALLAAGAPGGGRAYYPVVAVTHLAWIAGLFFLFPATAPISIPLLAYLALQVVRYWVIGTLGRYWTHRIITLEMRRSFGAGLTATSASQLRRDHRRDVPAAGGVRRLGPRRHHDRRVVSRARRNKIVARESRPGPAQ